MKTRIFIISLVLVAVLSTVVFATTGKITNAQSGLILRKSASKGGEVITTIANGTEVEIIEKSGDWYKVKYKNQEGYLFAEFVKPNEEVKDKTEEKPAENNDSKNTTTDIKVYIMPQITSTVIKTIPKGDEITVIEKAGNWSYITSKGTYGWIRALKSSDEVKTEKTAIEKTPAETKAPTETKQTTETKVPTETKTETPSSLKRGYINVDSAYVRQEPSKGAKIVTTLILNTGVQITGESGNWYKITYQDKISGYISKDLISANPQ